MSEVNELLAQEVRFMREEAGIRLDTLSERTGIPVPTLSKYMRARIPMPIGVPTTLIDTMRCIVRERAAKMGAIPGEPEPVRAA